MDTDIVYDGKVWHLWSALYLYDGKTYSLEFYAESEEDAIARIEAMRGTISDGRQILEQIDGEDVDDNFDPDNYMDGLKGE
jgi:hypothetical protein